MVKRNAENGIADMKRGIAVETWKASLASIDTQLGREDGSHLETTMRPSTKNRIDSIEDTNLTEKERISQAMQPTRVDSPDGEGVSQALLSQQQTSLYFGRFHFNVKPKPFLTGLPIKDFQPPTNHDIKEVHYFEGNLVLDIPMPPKFLETFPHAAPPERNEFSHMRYTAPASPSADFKLKNLTFRPLLFAKPRTTEILIEIVVGGHSMRSVAAELSAIFHSVCYTKRVFGDDYWKKILILIEGHTKHIDSNVYALLSALGVYCRPYKELFEKEGDESGPCAANVFEVRLPYTPTKDFLGLMKLKVYFAEGRVC